MRAKIVCAPRRSDDRHSSQGRTGDERRQGAHTPKKGKKNMNEQRIRKTRCAVSILVRRRIKIIAVDVFALVSLCALCDNEEDKSASLHFHHCFPSSFVVPLSAVPSSLYACACVSVLPLASQSKTSLLYFLRELLLFGYHFSQPYFLLRFEC